MTDREEKAGALERAVRAGAADAVRFWAELCAIESPTRLKEAVDRVGLAAAARARARGWEARRFPVARSGDCWALTLHPEAPGRPVAFSAHMDTVHEPGAFGPRPVRTEGDWLYGPGAVDDKGGLAAAVLAMEALEDAGLCARPVTLLLQSDEENGSVQCGRESIGFICREASRCAAFFNCEYARPGRAVVRRKGVLHLRLDVTGRGIHAARCYDGVSAVAEAARKIEELEKLKDPAGVTCSCGVVNGGTAVNAVPETCTILADVRYFTAEELEWARAYVRRTAETSFVPGSRCRVTELSCRIPMADTEGNRRLLAHSNEIWRACGLPGLEAEDRYGGSDAAEVTACGVPTLDGVGVQGADTHSVRERAYIPSLTAAALRLAAAAAFLDERAVRPPLTADGNQVIV